jgi:hypothetical protein
VLLEGWKTDVPELSADPARGSPCRSKVGTIIKHFLNDITIVGRKSLGHKVGSVYSDNKTKGVVWVLGNLRGEPQIAVILVATFMKKF